VLARLAAVSLAFVFIWKHALFMNPPPLPRRRNVVIRLLAGLWATVNFTRNLILNLFFFGFLLLLLLSFLGAVASERLKPLQEHTTLVIAPQGRLVEQYSSDALSRALGEAMNDDSAREIQLRDVLRALEAARDESKIERVVLELDRLRPSGLASLREMAKAVQAVRASGKQVIAFSENMNQWQYLLAAQADEIWLDPMGGVLLEGLSRYRLYYRTALQDKLGVDVHLFKVGEYKSAAEPYVLDAASPEALQADLYWMSDLWQRYLADIAQARQLDVAQLINSIDTLPEGIAATHGDLAQFALQQGLIDELKTRSEAYARLTQLGVAETEKNNLRGFRHITLEDWLKQVDAQQSPFDSRPQVAVVVAEGEIAGGDQPVGKVGGQSTSALLHRARKDASVKAVVLRVNSPGGEVFASEQIRREVEVIQQAGKPVVVSMGDMAASGGYWISMNADRIYADASTITGSIGIFGLVPNVARSLDKIGVHADGVGTTRFAGAFDLTRPLDPNVGQVIQSVIDKGYADFIGRVAQARGRSVSATDAVARGRVWSGAQALERNLVDEMGGLSDALNEAARRAQLEEGNWQVRYIEKDGSTLERFMSRFAASGSGTWLLADAHWARALLAPRMSPLNPALDDLHFVENALTSRQGMPVKTLAYCFCGL